MNERSRKPSSVASISGFTLMEMVVVLAVLAALAAAVAPAVVTYLRDAQRTQAEADAARIASAISKFTQDTALLPYKNTTANPKVSAKQTDDFDCLYGPLGAGLVSDGTAGSSWTVPKCDSIHHHLIANTPLGAGAKAYFTSGNNAWRGPYLSSLPPDPWGNMFLVNIGRGDPAASPKKAVFVISAGPNGVVETSADAPMTGIVTASGDDVIARVQ